MITSTTKVNPLNNVLYKNKDENKKSPFISTNSIKPGIKVQIYNSEGKIQLISAYHFHPDKTDWWKTILHWFVELIWGNTAVLIKVHGEQSALYMRVNELSDILKVPAQKINSKAIAKDATQYVSGRQKKAALNKVKSYACNNGIVWNKTHQESIQTLVERMTYRNICRVLDSNELGMDKISAASLLIDIGKELNLKHQTVIINNNNQSKKFGYTISLPDIYLWSNGKNEKIKINLRDLVLSREALPQQQASEKSSPLSQLFSFSATTPKVNECQIQFEQIASQLGFKEDLKHLHSLAKRVNYSNLLEIIGRLEGDEKKIMMNTYVAIGKQFTLPAFFDRLASFFRLNYQKKQKQNKKVISHAFAISKNNIFINQVKFAEGSFKIILTALRINDLSKPFIRVKTKKAKETGNPFLDLIAGPTAIAETKSEAKLLDRLQKTNNPYLMLPYLCEIKSKDGKSLVLFQRQYDGVGTELKTASVFHQLAAIIDYAKGLSLLHKANYVHMDGKPANILFEGDLNDLTIPVRAKVSDFGMTCRQGVSLKGGTLAYLPPEALRGNSLNPGAMTSNKIDSYSLGVSIYEIIMNWEIDRMLSQLSESTLDGFFNKAAGSLDDSNDQIIKSKILDVARALLLHNPFKRLSCKEAADRLTEIQKNHYGQC